MVIENKKILLTGGAGFIGSQIARRLISKNEIVIFDNLHRNALAYTDLAESGRVTVIQGDVLDGGSLMEAARGCNVLVHLAAIAGVDTVMCMPTLTMKVNLLGTFNALEAGLRRVWSAS